MDSFEIIAYLAQDRALARKRFYPIPSHLSSSSTCFYTPHTSITHHTHIFNTNEGHPSSLLPSRILSCPLLFLILRNSRWVKFCITHLVSPFSPFLFNLSLWLFLYKDLGWRSRRCAELAGRSKVNPHESRGLLVAFGNWQQLPWQYYGCLTSNHRHCQFSSPNPIGFQALGRERSTGYIVLSFWPGKHF